MWLLHTTELTLQDFISNLPDYVILSHTWRQEEVTFEEILSEDQNAKHKHGYKKILGACAQAAKDGFDWIWIDTCCINKKSSAELSEAINSMYEWYWNAGICYVYLEDVSESESELISHEYSAFHDSRWFERGWTLQELLAPEVLEFYNYSWEFLGSKHMFASEIRKRTDIGHEYIVNRMSIQEAYIGEKFSWVSRRRTTRTEDIAYCLLGLVQVSMPLLYGEGTSAFHRLQLELLKKTNDHSILVWEMPGFNDAGVGALAPAPRHFAFHTWKICRPLSTARAAEALTHEVTNNGLRITLPCKEREAGRLCARLHCTYGKDSVTVVQLKYVEQHQRYRRTNDLLENKKNEEFLQDIDDWPLQTIYIELDDARVHQITRYYKMRIESFLRTDNVFVNGVSISTSAHNSQLLSEYKYGGHEDGFHDVEQTDYLMNHLLIEEKQLVYVRFVVLSRQDSREIYHSVVLVFGLVDGRPWVKTYTDHREDSFSRNWYRTLDKSVKQLTSLERHYDLGGEPPTQIQFKCTSRKVRRGFENIWTMELQVLACNCRPGQPYCVHERIYTIRHDDHRIEGTDEPSFTERPEHQDRPHHKQSKVAMMLASLRRGKALKDHIQISPGISKTRFLQSQKLLSKTGAHFIECECSKCRSEGGKIQLQPIHCEDESCKACELGRLKALWEQNPPKDVGLSTVENSFYLEQLAIGVADPDEDIGIGPLPTTESMFPWKF